MSKYKIIQDNTDDYWLNEFQNQLGKAAVQSKQIDNSLFDQISSIINNSKSKYTSVESAVEEMKNRSGLTQYLNKKSFNNKNIKVANEDPIVIQMKPEIKKTIKNIIHDNKGNSPVPAILEKIKNIYKNDISDEKHWEDDKLIKLINDLIFYEKQNYSIPEYTQLGIYDNNQQNVDPSNKDVFLSLSPAIANNNQVKKISTDLNIILKSIKSSVFQLINDIKDLMPSCMEKDKVLLALEDVDKKLSEQNINPNSLQAIINYLNYLKHFIVKKYSSLIDKSNVLIEKIKLLNHMSSNYLDNM